MEKPCKQTMLGRWLRHCRGNKSQAEAAHAIGMDQSELSKWETGDRRRATPTKLQQFADGLEMPIESMALAYAEIWPPDVMDLDEDAPMMGARHAPVLAVAAADLVARLDHQSRATIQQWLEDQFHLRPEVATRALTEKSDEHIEA